MKKNGTMHKENTILSMLTITITTVKHSRVYQTIALVTIPKW